MTMPCATAPSPAALSINEHHVSLLHRCTTLRHMKQLQAFLLSLGHGRTQFYALKLMRFSALVLADIPYARLIFESLPAPNVFLYSALISAYASRPDPDSPAALRLFAAMLRGVPAPRPNEFIYPSLLKSCSDPRLARSLHSLLSKSGFHDFAVVRTALLDSYSRFSDTHAARYLFDEMPQKNVVSWTALLTGYMRTGQMGKALFMFEEMPDMDVPAWNVVISGCTQNGLFSEALSFFSRMVIDGARPNKTTVSASSPLVCILVCSGSGNPSMGMSSRTTWEIVPLFAMHSLICLANVAL